MRASTRCSRANPNPKPKPNPNPNPNPNPKPNPYPNPNQVKTYKSSKQWGAAKEFAERALPIAREMVVFDHDANNGARSAVLTALQALQAEAQGNMCID